MAFVDSAGHHGFHSAPSESYGEQHHHRYAPTSTSTSTSSMADPAKPSYYTTNLPPPMSCDIKPRLTKEQHDILEAHFQTQSKPSTNVKKGFAETLNVSLDKVNNWFQNRRAKSKQDAKKQGNAFNLYTQHHPSTLTLSSDSDTSPAFSSSDYYAMMQHCTTDDQTSNGIGMGHMAHFQEQPQAHGLPYASHTALAEQVYQSSLAPSQSSLDMFDSPLELNRRTLTQEQFDAFAQNGGMVGPSGHFDSLQNGFSGDAGLLHQVFPMHQDDFKQPEDFTFPAPIRAPLSSNDSSIPSTISEQSMFPSSTPMQDAAAMSSTSSDWGDSRSSSVSANHGQENSFPAMPASHPQLAQATASKWQPGQSVPVDPSDLQRQFTEAQQRAQQHQQGLQTFPDEQPLAWPADEAYVRRDSQNGTALAEQMSGFAIQTPHPPQDSTFKRPAPLHGSSASIAARRHRPRPATLGLASLRSQSYSGTAQPASPGQQASQNLAPGQPLRRIRSSNVLNGVAQGRVMKSIPGSAQRSPLGWTFADALHSPSVRQPSVSSTGNLEPPTPLSPTEMQQREHSRSQFPPWQSSGPFSRQASISESEESNLAHVTSQKVSSPPHTPMYHHHQQHQMAQVRVGSTVITENTPPQSAPALQTTFPANSSMPQPQQQLAHVQQHFVPPPNQTYMSMPEPQYQVPQPYQPAQNLVVGTTEAQQPMQMQVQFSNAVPIVNAQGELTMGYPPHLQEMHFIQPHQQHMGTQYSFVNVPGAPGGMHITSQLPKPPAQPAAELFVHEYSPPSDVKRTATPRKPPPDSGPKNYTFANQTPEHFEKDKAKKEAKSTTASPESAGSSSSA